MPIKILIKNLKPAFTDSLLHLTDEIKKVIPVDKGRLVGSIHPEVISMGENILEGKVGTDVGDINNPKEDPPYPLYLEFGTSKMAPRAMFRRGIAAA